MMKRPSWREYFPDLFGLSTKVATILDKRARTISLDQGTVIFHPGKSAENLLLLVSGTVRVQKISDGGRKIDLHRVHAGETCVLTTACLLAFGDSRIEGLSETDIEGVLIPREALDEIMRSSREFRAFVFEAYSKCITDLSLATEEIACSRERG